MLFRNMLEIVMEVCIAIIVVMATVVKVWKELLL